MTIGSEKYDKVHGRIETRTIKVYTLPQEYTGWENVQQVFEITRIRETKTKKVTEFAYGITSLRADEVSPTVLLKYTRKHWEIENRLHYVRDVAFDEDRCRVRIHSKAHILAAIRNTAITLLRHAGFTNIYEGREVCASDRRKAIRLVLARTE
jgi:predicted transposase YbfD/YdcC